MKRLLLFFLPILLTSCTSADSIFSPIRTIKCKQIFSSGKEYSYQPKSSKEGEPEVIIFNKKTGELFFYDNFFETLTPMSEGDAKWIKSTIINGKLKINQGKPKKVWGEAVIDLKNLTGKYLFTNLSTGKESVIDMKCIKVKNLSTKVK